MNRLVGLVVEEVSRASGRIHLPVARRALDSDAAVSWLEEHCADGAVLLGRCEWYLCNIMIPGFWSHAAIYHQGKVIEAIAQGVVATDFSAWVKERDAAAVVYPTFAAAGGMQRAAELAARQVGKGYDWEFKIGARAFYCAELVWWSYKRAVPVMLFELRRRYGRPTVCPQDFADATKHWRIQVCGA